MFFADYMAKDIVVRNSDIQGMEQGIIAPMAGFGPNPNLTIENTYLRNWENVTVPAVGSVNGCWMDNKMVVLINSHLEMAPGMPANHIAMVGDVARVPALCPRASGSIRSTASAMTRSSATAASAARSSGRSRNCPAVRKSGA